MTTTELKRHPLSEFWPDMRRDDLVELIEDVRANGVIEPIVMLDGKILDGWHRYLASQEAGRECPAVEYEGDDPAAYVVSRNKMRRWASRKDLVKAVLQCVGWRKAGRQAKAEAKPEATGEEPAPAKEMTLSEVAKDVGVSVPTVSRARREIREERGEVEPRQQPKPKRRSTGSMDSVREQIQQLLTERDDARAEVERLKARVSELEVDLADARDELSDLREGAGEDGGGVSLATLRSQLREVENERDILKDQLYRIRTNPAP